jgi:hypothetical protein
MPLVPNERTAMTKHAVALEARIRSISASTFVACGLALFAGCSSEAPRPDVVTDASTRDAANPDPDGTRDAANSEPDASADTQGDLRDSAEPDSPIDSQRDPSADAPGPAAASGCVTDVQRCSDVCSGLGKTCSDACDGFRGKVGFAYTTESQCKNGRLSITEFETCGGLISTTRDYLKCCCG